MWFFAFTQTNQLILDLFLNLYELQNDSYIYIKFVIIRGFLACMAGVREKLHVYRHFTQQDFFTTTLKVVALSPNSPSTMDVFV